MLRQILVAALALSAASLLGTAAYAHPELKVATPPVDGSAKSGVKEIRLSFSEGVILKFSGIELKDQNGKAIATDALATDPKDKKQLVLPLKAPLQAGTYTVDWHAVSEDTHRVKGHYSFKVEQ